MKSIRWKQTKQSKVQKEQESQNTHSQTAIAHISEFPHFNIIKWVTKIFMKTATTTQPVSSSKTLTLIMNLQSTKCRKIDWFIRGMSWGFIRKFWRLGKRDWKSQRSLTWWRLIIWGKGLRVWVIFKVKILKFLNCNSECLDWAMKITFGLQFLQWKNKKFLYLKLRLFLRIKIRIGNWGRNFHLLCT